MTPALVLVALALEGDVASSNAPAPPREDEPASPNLVVPTLHNLALLGGVRIAETILWPDPFAKTWRWRSYYEETFTRPPVFDADKPFMRWDGDPLVVNVVGHALMGSELYMRPRMCNVPWYGALAFAAAGSTLWEYVFEGNGVRPSAQDLVYTPLAGLVLGEARYGLVRLSRTIESKEWRSALRAVADPFGEIERVAGAPC